MRPGSVLLSAVLLMAPSVQAFACAVCSTSPDSKTGQSMAMAVWFLMAAVMSVLGGVGLFSLHLWRQARTPLEPHQQLTEEDLNQYD